jgi:hypothetical protein
MQPVTSDTFLGHLVGNFSVLIIPTPLHIKKLNFKEVHFTFLAFLLCFHPWVSFPVYGLPIACSRGTWLFPSPKETLDLTSATESQCNRISKAKPAAENTNCSK